MQQIDVTCPLCLEEDMALNTLLMRHGPAETAMRRRMEKDAAAPNGILMTHWQHLKQAIALPDVTETPAPDADPIIKTRWAQQQLFRLTFAADEIFPEKPQEQIMVHRSKQATLTSLLGSIRLEAELLGHVEKAKIKGKRQAEREMAKEEMREEALMSPEEQLKLQAATLRLHGYTVQRDVTPETIDVTEEQ